MQMEPESSEELIEGIARRVEKWGLVVPFVLFLEVARPLGFFGGQMLHMAQPLLGDRSRGYALLLEDRSGIDRILDRLGRDRRDSSSLSR